MLHAPLLALALAAAAPIHPMTVDDLLAFDRVGDPSLSPDGTQVAFTVSRPKADGSGLTAAVWLVPAAGGEPTPLAPGLERSSGARFSPDGTRLAVVAPRGAARVRGCWSSRSTAASRSRCRPSPAARPATAGPPTAAPCWCWPRSIRPAAPTWPATRRRTRRRPGRPTPPTGSSSATGTSGAPASASTCCGCRSTGDRSPTSPPAIATCRRPTAARIDDVAVSPDGATVYVTAMTDPVEAISTNADLLRHPAGRRPGPARHHRAGLGRLAPPLARRQAAGLAAPAARRLRVGPPPRHGRGRRRPRRARPDRHARPLGRHALVGRRRPGAALHRHRGRPHRALGGGRRGRLRRGGWPAGLLAPGRRSRPRPTAAAGGAGRLAGGPRRGGAARPATRPPALRRLTRFSAPGARRRSSRSATARSPRAARTAPPSTAG